VLIFAPASFFKKRKIMGWQPPSFGAQHVCESRIAGQSIGE